MCYLSIIFPCPLDIQKPSVSHKAADDVMSEDEFVAWLQSRGISRKDCEILTGSYYNKHQFRPSCVLQRLCQTLKNMKDMNIVRL